MAESKGALIAKSMQKHAGRAKEKLLQNLGKVDRTLDDIFEEHLQNFNRQHQQAMRLQKEFNNYIRCIRAVQTASKSLMEAITEVYESGWSGHDLLYVQAQNMEMLWQDFSHKLGDQVLIPLNTYTNQFPEVRKKVEKRGRKLVDYDSQRHSFQNLQANAAKRRDDVKVTKGREQLEEAKRTYEVLNSELHDELPALYDSRVLFYVNNLQTLFSAEQLFHAESSKLTKGLQKVHDYLPNNLQAKLSDEQLMREIFGEAGAMTYELVFLELEAITDKLATDCQRGAHRKPALPNNLALNGNSAAPANAVQTPASPALNGNAGGASPAPARPATLPPTPPDDTPPSREATPTDDKPSSTKVNDIEKDQEDTPVIPPTATLPVAPSAPAAPARHSDPDRETNGDANDKKVEELYDIPVGSPVPPEKSNSEAKKQLHIERGSEKERKDSSSEQKDEVYDIPVGATLAGLPAGTLYRVRATYRYTREDSDELSFDVGDLIRVVEYDDPDEQEEGWLMGIKESTNEKGMFPANFTRPI